jgi:hypothetical protein|tara:strand:+ start:2738 stop:3163 length:426 start_codon:yes stop_codon:yes gene_type:complete
MLINLTTGQISAGGNPPSTQEKYKALVDTYESDKISHMKMLRDWRDKKISESDWMVVKASESGGSISTAWANYRQALRDLPSHSRAPNRFLIADWPLAPGETEVPEGLITFIAETRDPVGLGTTSWIGITTTGEYYQQPKS